MVPTCTADGGTVTTSDTAGNTAADSASIAIETAASIASKASIASTASGTAMNTALDSAALSLALSQAKADIQEKELLISTLLAEIDTLSGLVSADAPVCGDSQSTALPQPTSPADTLILASRVPLPPPDLDELQEEAAAEIERLLLLLSRVRADRDTLRGQLEFLSVEAQCQAVDSAEQARLQCLVDQLTLDFEAVLSSAEGDKKSLRLSTEEGLRVKQELGDALMSRDELRLKLGRREDQIARHQAEIGLRDANLAALEENLAEVLQELGQSAKDQRQKEARHESEVVALIGVVVQKVAYLRVLDRDAKRSAKQAAALRQDSAFKQQQIEDLQVMLAAAQESQAGLTLSLAEMSDVAKSNEALRAEVGALRQRLAAAEDVQVELDAKKDAMQTLLATHHEAVKSLEAMEEENLKLRSQMKVAEEDFVAASEQRTRMLERYKNKQADDSNLIRKLQVELQAVPNADQLVAPYQAGILEIRQKVAKLHRTMPNTPLDVSSPPKDHKEAMSEIHLMISDWRDWSDDLEPRLAQQAEVQDELDVKYHQALKKVQAYSSFTDKMKVHLKFKTKQCEELTAKVDILELERKTTSARIEELERTQKMLSNPPYTATVKSSSVSSVSRVIASNSPQKYSTVTGYQSLQHTRELSNETDNDYFPADAPSTSTTALLGRPELKKSHSVVLMEKMNFSLNSPAPNKVQPPSITPSSKKRNRTNEELRPPGREAVMRLADEENGILDLPQKLQMLSPALARLTPRQPLSKVAANSQPLLAVGNRLREMGTPRARERERASGPLGVREHINALKSLQLSK